ncbi:MAG: sulfatase-like hydrolase/transferase [Lentisphaerae bacterium]|nr:sulfatase-like hydrolase/transferase [Lentisphaerota bacterium]
MNVICILMDSLNRHFLPTYGNTWVQAPNLERLARRAVIFDRAFIGSMPCMPARRDLWTGNQEFLWRPWGSLEPWDRPLPRTLKEAGVFTGLVTDHYHFWESGGENYHTTFNTIEFIRGHENDPWAGGPLPPMDAGKGVTLANYWRNQTRFTREEDWMSPRTFRAATDWLADNARAHERFFLMIDEFDPHEPFDGPEALWRQYDPDWRGPTQFHWPKYGRNDYTEAEARHLRARYAAKVTLADRSLGRLLDRMDADNLWENTAVILMTDHGHFLGDHGWWGKPGCPQYRTIANVPLMISVPGCRATPRTAALATHVDIHATILDCFGVRPADPIDGVSLLPVLKGERETVRADALFGLWGHWVHWTDGRRVYMRAPVRPDNQPLCFYTNRWSTAPWWRLPPPGDRTTFGRFMPRVAMPLCRHPVREEESQRLGNIVMDEARKGSLLFDWAEDPEEQNNLSGTPQETECLAALARLMETQTAPPEQFERLGIARRTP